MPAIDPGLRLAGEVKAGAAVGLGLAVMAGPTVEVGMMGADVSEGMAVANSPD